jgi:glycosyltransferase involved in cell wall biosynthesis
MKCAIVADYYSPPWDEGFKILTRNLVLYLEQKGDQVYILSTGKIDRRRFLPKFLTIIPMIRKLETVLAINKIVRQEGIDIIFEFTSARPFFAVRPFFWSKLLGVPYYIYITSVTTRHRFYSLLANQERIFVGGDYLKKYFPRAHVLYPFVDLDALSVNGVASQNGRHPKTILFLGAFQKERGLHHLLDAIAELKKELDFRLLIAWNGRGELKEEFHTQIKARGIEEITMLKGSVDISELYNAADIVVIPRILHPKLETKMFFPLRMIEAMYFSKPMVVSDIYDWASVVDGCGVAVKQGSVEELSRGMLKLLRDEEFYKTCVQNCCTKLTKFLPDTVHELDIKS